MLTALRTFLLVALWFMTIRVGLAEPRLASPPTAPQGLEEALSSPCRSDTNPQETIHVEQNVSKSLLIHKVVPSYPAAARRAHIEGTVVMCASISKKGKIANLRAASGPPELIPPALKAVRKWRYKPYLLNDEPVQVETEIRVNFSIAR